MSKAEIQATTSRRAALGAFAATAIAAIAPASAVARAVCADDQIHMLIAEHKDARAAFDAALTAVGEYQSENRTETGGLPRREGHPALVVLEHIAGQASDRETRATVALLSLPPSTLPGAAALVRYLLECEQEGDDYLNCDTPDGAGYQALLISLVASLSSLVQQ